MLLVAVSLNIVAGAVYLCYVHGLITSRATGRSPLVGLLLLGSAMRLTALLPAPGLEDDFYRYLWDGAVLAHGVNPYRYSPEQASQASVGQSSVEPQVVALAERAKDTLARINHPELRTIYPPVAQAWFALAHEIRPLSFNAWRGVILLHDLVTVALLLALLKALGLPVVFVAVYWLNPLVVKEFHQAAHMDILVLPWVLGVLWAAVRYRTVLSMTLLAVAASVKLWPLLLAPILLRPALRRPKTLLAAGMAFAALWASLMAPMFIHEWAANSGLMKYAETWQNNAGFFMLHDRFWEWALPKLGGVAWYNHRVTRVVTAEFVLLWVVILAWRPIRDGADLCRRSLWGVAGLFLLGPTQFPWYFSWLVPLLAIWPVWPLLLYSALLPLYYLHYNHQWVLWFEHGLVWMLLLVAAIRLCRRKACSEPDSVTTAATEDVHTMRITTQ
jgi:hypothetical protein